MRLVQAAAFLWFLGPSVAAQPVGNEPVRVLVLGLYHFANPGQDLNNAVVDDVLAPNRQREIAAVVDALATFRPTAVATERRARPPYDDPAWTIFVTEADSALGAVRDESIQIGFRLALAVGTDRVYAIDEQAEEEDHLPGYFPIGAVADVASATGRADEFAAFIDGSEETAAFEARQRIATIPDLLLEKQADDDQFYWDVLTYGDGETQAGPELAAYWFLRNAKIFNKLVQVARPGDRIVVVFGGGHGAWLREMVRRARGFELEPAEPYLRAATVLLSNAPD